MGNAGILLSRNLLRKFFNLISERHLLIPPLSVIREYHEPVIISSLAGLKMKQTGRPERILLRYLLALSCEPVIWGAAEARPYPAKDQWENKQLLLNEYLISYSCQASLVMAIYPHIIATWAPHSVLAGTSTTARAKPGQPAEVVCLPDPHSEVEMSTLTSARLIAMPPTLILPIRCHLISNAGW